MDKNLHYIIDKHPPLYFLYCYNKYKVEKHTEYEIIISHDMFWFRTCGDYFVTDLTLGYKVFLNYKDAKQKCIELNKGDKQ